MLNTEGKNMSFLVDVCLHHPIKFTFLYIGRLNSTSKNQGSELGYCNYISCAFRKFLGFPPPEHARENSELVNDIAVAFPRMASDMPQISHIPNVPLLTMDPTNSTDDSKHKTNYQDWSDHMKSYLSRQGLWDIIEGSSRTNNTELDYDAWTKKNNVALNAIQVSCEPSVRAQIQGISSARIAWETLAKMDQLHAMGIHPTEQLATFASSGLNLGHPPNIAKPPSPSLFSQGLKLDMGHEGISELVRKLTANFNSNMPVPVSQEEERKLIIFMLQALMDEVKSLREWTKEIEKKLASDHHQEPTSQGENLAIKEEKK